MTVSGIEPTPGLSTRPAMTRALGLSRSVVRGQSTISGAWRELEQARAAMARLGVVPDVSTAGSAQAQMKDELRRRDAMHALAMRRRVLVPARAEPASLVGTHAVAATYAAWAMPHRATA